MSNCSLNRNSKFWTEDNIQKAEKEEMIKNIIEKSSNNLIISIEEFKIYLDSYSKTNSFPSIDD